MKASQLITRSLRLINQPGRGSQLGATDQNNAFEALQELIDSEAVSKQFVPGITRHFFPMVAGKSIYSYGASPQLDLRSDNFATDPSFGDPAPIKIEGAYIREGSAITDNELVDEYRFENVGSWVVGAGAAISNNQYVAELAVTSSTQVIAPVVGRTYTLRADVEVFAGTLEVRLRNAAVAFTTFILDTSGLFSFDFVWGAGITPDVEIATLLVTDDVKLNAFSIIERGLERLELPDSQGSDYTITLVDQTRYNRRFTKGTGGRPYNILYSRSYQRGEIRFDNSAIAGDILVLDVLTNKVQVNRLSDEVRINPEGIKWLRYALADDVSGEYGKTLSNRQLEILNDAWDQLAISNRRRNMLGVDRALRNRPTFDINRGDP